MAASCRVHVPLQGFFLQKSISSCRSTADLFFCALMFPYRLNSHISAAKVMDAIQSSLFLSFCLVFFSPDKMCPHRATKCSPFPLRGVTVHHYIRNSDTYMQSLISHHSAARFAHIELSIHYERRAPTYLQISSHQVTTSYLHLQNSECVRYI